MRMRRCCPYAESCDEIATAIASRFITTALFSRSHRKNKVWEYMSRFIAQDRTAAIFTKGNCAHTTNWCRLFRPGLVTAPPGPPGAFYINFDRRHMTSDPQPIYQDSLQSSRCGRAAAASIRSGGHFTTELIEEIEKEGDFVDGRTLLGTGSLQHSEALAIRVHVKV